MYRNTTHHPRRGSGIALLIAGGLAPVVAWADSADAAPVHCYGFVATVVGTEGSDIIDAADGVTNERDVIAARGGNDVIFGLGGDDVICGNDGNDVIFGDAGIDKIAGNTGDDRIFGGSRQRPARGLLRRRPGQRRAAATTASTVATATASSSTSTGATTSSTAAAATTSSAVPPGRDRLEGDTRQRHPLRIRRPRPAVRQRPGIDDVLWGGAGRDFLRSIDTPAIAVR